MMYMKSEGTNSTHSLQVPKKLESPGKTEMS
jgi:hypothetical protein